MLSPLSEYNEEAYGDIKENAVENGRIINVSSMASFGLFPFISPYCASKRCLDMFFNSFSLDSSLDTSP